MSELRNVKLVMIGRLSDSEIELLRKDAELIPEEDAEDSITDLVTLEIDGKETLLFCRSPIQEMKGKIERRGNKARVVCPNGHASTDHEIYEVTPVEEWREIESVEVENGQVYFVIDSDPGDPEGNADFFRCGQCDATFEIEGDYRIEYS